MTYLALACRLLGAEHRSWVSQAEASRIAASGSMSTGIWGADPEPVSVIVRRAALNLDAPRIVDDLLVLCAGTGGGSRKDMVLFAYGPFADAGSAPASRHSMTADRKLVR